MFFTKWARNLWKRNANNTPRRRHRLPLRLEQLEDRVVPTSPGWTIVAGPAGTGSLDRFLSPSDETITTADNPGGASATVSTGALQQVGAGVPISITADTSVAFDDIGTLTLNNTGADVSFTTKTGNISFANLANTLSASPGGSLGITAGAGLTVANLNAANIALGAASDIAVAGSLTAAGTVTISSSQGAVLDADTGETEPSNPADNLTNGASADITATTLRMSAATGIGIVSGAGVGPL